MNEYSKYILREKYFNYFMIYLLYLSIELRSIRFCIMSNLLIRNTIVVVQDRE